MKKAFLLIAVFSFSFSPFAQFGATLKTPDFEQWSPFETSGQLTDYPETVHPAQNQSVIYTNNDLPQPAAILSDQTFFGADFQANQVKQESGTFFRNRRNTYSSLWAFASLNYLYADLVGLMDHHKLTQYLSGTVEGIDITPGFLTGAAAFMQIPLANVFLPQVIKNDRVLRWVQIASGSVMTLVQGATLFVGKPAPYYALFSAFEMAATTFITVDAIRWKPKKNRVINTEL